MSIELDRFREACTAGVAVKRRLSPLGIGKIGLPKALEMAVTLDSVHPAAQMEFLRTWTRVTFGTFRDGIDDETWYAALRKLLPPYTGGPIRLYRGQLRGEPVGMSWTRSYHIASKFCFYGTAYEPTIRELSPRDNGVLLSAVMCGEIICAPCLHGHLEGEYIVDPRGVKL